VVSAVAEGLTNADIADQLYMSVPTVKAHITHIRTKLGLTNRTQSRCSRTMPGWPDPHPPS
jgi:DNA-binding NarL/FixJ family response regulator